MPKRHAITDAQWDRIKEFFPSNGEHAGHPWKDHRLMLDGILWIKKTGAPWRDLPARFGPWETVYYRFRLWTRSGLFSKIMKVLQEELNLEGKIDWKLFCVDGTNVRAHRSAAGARRGAA